MNKIALITLISVISFSSFGATLEDEAKSGNSQAAYKLAEFYENKNDLKNALYWYKTAAKLSLQTQETVLVAQNSPALTEQTDTVIATAPTSAMPVNVAQQTHQAAISDRIATTQDYQSGNIVFKALDSSFGLKPYHSNYILPLTYDAKSHDDGRKQTETTFQLSLKKNVFIDQFGFDERIGFAYTQRSWWQTTEESSPFRETNYLPEIYVQIPSQAFNNSLKGTQFGFLHESNGQGNDAGKSRSWNRLYLEGYFQYHDTYLVPRVWYRIPEDKAHDDNRDIEDYLGYGDLTVFVPYQQHLVRLLIRNNLSFNDNRGAIQIDWTYPLWDTGLFAYVQYFNGYGESLIDYNKRTNRLGIGVALSR
ncbi:phospholipase A1 [Orbus hercynius]|uniref:Phospholipase A1 n=1 Tax=Orbus hercynius TaxID=593135 RepID=A0A495RJU3_9GAMM|nr:phospholipase A [Orbus hercynius]RKS87584.1 phospholipase A1 [Orbus hercynius]